MSECMTQEDAMNMNNEQAIQILKPLRNMMIDQHGCPISSAVFALDKAIKALSAQQWIPCSERLPEPDEEYLVTVRERWRDKEWTNHVDMAWLNSDPAAGYIGGWETWNDWREGQEVEIIAWMPLPKPYDDFSEHMNEPEEE